MNIKKLYILIPLALLLIGFYFLLASNTPIGWTYRPEITHDFYEQYVPFGWAGYSWKIYYQNSNPINIRAYGRVVTPGASWGLDGEGTYIDGVFKWTWNNFPFDVD